MKEKKPGASMGRRVVRPRITGPAALTPVFPPVLFSLPDTSILLPSLLPGAQMHPVDPALVLDPAILPDPTTAAEDDSDYEYEYHDHETEVGLRI